MNRDTPIAMFGDARSGIVRAPGVRPRGALRPSAGFYDDGRMEAWPLVGRDEELALCRRVLLDECRSVVVVAPAGTGKTRIVQQVVHDLHEDAVTESIVATRSAQGLPLAAVAALLPADAAVPAEPIELFRRRGARSTNERPAGR